MRGICEEIREVAVLLVVCGNCRIFSESLQFTSKLLGNTPTIRYPPSLRPVIDIKDLFHSSSMHSLKSPSLPIVRITTISPYLIRIPCQQPLVENTLERALQNSHAELRPLTVEYRIFAMRALLAAASRATNLVARPRDGDTATECARFVALPTFCWATF